MKGLTAQRRISPAGIIFLILMFLLTNPGPAKGEASYPDGIYRGFYYDGGIEQLSVQFELKDGLFASLTYRGVRYKDGDYLSQNASDAQKATLKQYYQLADYLIGKGISAIDDLYTPYAFVESIDSVTSATIQSSKLISAIWDGLNRHPYKLVDTTKLQTAMAYADGLYHGQYTEHGGLRIELEFELKQNVFTALSVTALGTDGTDQLSGSGPESAAARQAALLRDYLTGKPVSAVNDLYQAESLLGITEEEASAMLPFPALISAVWDALGRHAYRIVQ